MTGARLVGWSVVFSFTLGIVLGGESATSAQSALGLTHRGEPIAVHLAPEAANLNHRGARLVIIGGHDGDPASTGIVEQLRRDLNHVEAAAKHKSLVTFVPNAYPAGLAKGVADEEATRSYPPENGYYNDPHRPESRYLWRWTTQYGADLVIDIRTGKDAGFWMPKGLPTVDWLELILARDWKKLPQPAADDFVVQLSSKGVSDTGITPALILQIPPASKETAFKKINLLLQLAQTLDRSPARRELIRREGLSAQDVSLRLSSTYGEDLFKLPIAPDKLTLDLMRNYPGVLGPWYEGWIDDARRASEWGWSPNKLKKFYEDKGIDTPKNQQPDRDTELVRELYFMALADRTGRNPGSSWNDLLASFVEPAADQFDGCETIINTARPLVRSGWLNARPQFTSAGLAHYRRVRNACRRDDGLFRHSPEVDVAWGRANGLAAMGLALILTDLPKDHPAMDELSTDLAKHLSALLKHQDEFGHWRQVIDKPGSYAEFSATCLIAWTLRRGLEYDWLDVYTFQPALERAWRAVKRRISEEGLIGDMCGALVKPKTLPDYLGSPARSGLDNQGGAIAILLATELMASGFGVK